MRTHRLLSPNRRPLLISALLVAFTSVPTMIVVAAGSATLDTAPSVRSPILADPRPGPLVIDSSPRSGLGPSGLPPIDALPTEPQPPVKSRPVTSRSAKSGGAGGGVVVVTRPATSSPAPAPEVQKPPPPVVVTPPATTPPKTSPPADSGVVPIQDRAWPGWDRKLKGKPESVRQQRPRKGSAVRSEQSDLKA